MIFPVDYLHDTGCRWLVISLQEKKTLTWVCELQVKQIDLIQLHWWDYGVPGLMDVIYRLADLQAEGVVRSIGVTNLDTAHVETITDAGINLVSNQVRPVFANSRCLLLLHPLFCDR